MKYKHLFFDLDHTLWDFEANARATLLELHHHMKLEERGILDFDLFHKNYLAHNEHLWERYRKGLIKQDELRTKRMKLSLLDFKIADDILAKEMSIRFLELLPTMTILFPGTKEVLGFLTEKKYQLHLITNGFEATQHSKLKFSGLYKFFDAIVTSESSNSLKPRKEIFEYAFQKTSARQEESIMIGDNIEVDIMGAMNAGIDQVYVNHLGTTSAIQPTFIVHHLKELETIF